MVNAVSATDKTIYDPGTVPARPSAGAAHEDRRAAMLTVALQESIADVRPAFGERTA